MNSELKHIFDKSACLSRRQLKDYVAGQMANEECHAVEHHLNGCPLCSAAIDGMLLNPGKALETVNGMNTDFLKEHFGVSEAEVPLNTMTPEAAAAPQVIKIPKVKTNIQPLWRNVSIAAAVLFAVGLFWYLKPGPDDAHTEIAQNLETDKSSEPATTQQDELKATDAPPVENTVVAAEAPAATTPAETETKLVEDKAAIAALNKKAQDDKLAAAAGEAKKSKADVKIGPPVPASPVIADKKALTEKAKPSPETKKAEAAATKTIAAGKVAAKEEHQTAAQTVTARKDDAGNRTARDNDNTIQTYNQTSTAPASRAEAAAGAATDKSASDQLPADRLDRGKYYYEKQNWNAALKEYRVEINNTSKAKRHQASYMAAQCYLKVGNSKEAERLLKIVVDEGGPQKRQAKKLLEAINKPQPEK